MSKPSSSLLVAIVDQAAFIRIVGRANFTASLEFKTLVNELKEHGFKQFVLDLGGCTNMDSTFLGVLAGNAQPAPDQPSPVDNGCVQLLNPNPRVTELLENLGIAHLFHICVGSNLAEMKFVATTPPEGSPSREEISKTCLEAHRILMALNPENIAKFKDVAQFLAEDLQKAKS